MARFTKCIFFCAFVSVFASEAVASANADSEDTVCGRLVTNPRFLTRLERSQMPKGEERFEESDLILPALRMAAAAPQGTIATSTLIDALEAKLIPTGDDARIISGRQDTYFSQKVRNLISHRDGPGSFIANGFADYTPTDGIRITSEGCKLLRVLGGVK